MKCLITTYSWAELITFFFFLQVILSGVALLIGLVLIAIPRKVIDAQIALYRPFNWKLEPISMEKEIRNTRIMGWIMVLFCAVSVAFLKR
jgi:hypothetical protein